MKTVVLYDSVFGNTEKLALFIADAIGAAPMRITDNDADRLDAGLLIIGSPTRAFRPTPAVTAWIKKLPAKKLTGISAAAFDTRIDINTIDSKFLKKMAGRFGYASGYIQKLLLKKGVKLAAPPEGFYVTANEGPLAEGELKRAANWALTLADL
ncbi:MAG: hypothetical protein WDA65_03300 [Christensenellales bacterium]